MSPSSTGDSPRSATATATSRFPMPTRDSFTIDVPAGALSSVTNGAVNSIKSPTAIKTQRAASFSREGILGAAQKARNLSQPNDTRSDSLLGGNHKGQQSDDGSSSNPLKRRNPDSTPDYPRRRATIAVRPGPTNIAFCPSTFLFLFFCSLFPSVSKFLAGRSPILLTCNCSVRCAGRESLVVMEQSPSASSAPNLAPSVSIESPESSLMPVIN